MRPALLVDGVYGIVVGVLLLFPSWGAVVFGRQVTDAAVISGWGTSIIFTGLVALVAASDVTKYGGLAWVFVAGLLLAAVDLIYFWATGTYTARTVLVPVILNIVLAGWIWSARAKG